MCTYGVDARVQVRGDEAVSTLRPLVHSLGLFDDRLKALVSITQVWDRAPTLTYPHLPSPTRTLPTQAFLLGPDCFSVDLAEHKIHGVGKFGWQSWLIFCRDMGGTLKKVDDATPNLTPALALALALALTRTRTLTLAGTLKQVDDATLASFANWRKKQPEAAAGGPAEAASPN